MHDAGATTAARRTTAGWRSGWSVWRRTLAWWSPPTRAATSTPRPATKKTTPRAQRPRWASSGSWRSGGVAGRRRKHRPLPPPLIDISSRAVAGQASSASWILNPSMHQTRVFMQYRSWRWCRRCCYWIALHALRELLHTVVVNLARPGYELIICRYML